MWSINIVRDEPLKNPWTGIVSKRIPMSIVQLDLWLAEWAN